MSPLISPRTPPTLWVLWTFLTALGLLFVFATPWAASEGNDIRKFVALVQSSLAIRILVTILFCGLPAVCLRHASRLETTTLQRNLAPLALLSLVGAVSLNHDLLGIALVSNFRFFFPLFLVSLVLAKWWHTSQAMPEPPRRAMVLLLIPIALIYAWTCYYSLKTVGPSAGDECVYIVMADGIYTDRSLDTQQAWARLGHDRPRGFMHLAPNARDDMWYSWHPFGLPLLIAPAWAFTDNPVNEVGRSMAMGLLAALGCLGLWLLCRRTGASPLATSVALLLICGGVFWTSFASRVLTELPGAVLLIWLFWAIAARKDWPLLSLFIAVLTAVYCPFMHLRFLPLGLLGAFFYFVAIFSDGGEMKRRKKHAVAFVSLVGLGYLLWVAIQLSMYTGSSQPIGETLLSYPQGIWQIFFDRYAAGAAIVALYGLLAAQLFWWMGSPGQRLLQYAIFSTFLACVVLNCTNIYPFVSYWDSTPGRYLFVVIPLLAPGTAYALTHARLPARTFFLFLALAGLATTVLYFYLLPYAPQRTLAHHILFLAQQPVTFGFFMPFAAYLEFSTLTARIATIVFGVTATVCSFLLLRHSSDQWSLRPVACLLAMLMTAVIAHAVQ